MAANRLAWWLYKVTLFTLVALTVLVLLQDARRRRDWQVAAQREAMESHLRTALEFIQSGLAPDALQSADSTDAITRSIGRSASGHAAILDQERQVISVSSQTAITRHDDAPDITSALSGRVGYWETRLASSGEDVLFVAIPISRQGRVVGCLRLMRTRSADFLPAANSLGQLLLLGLILLGVAGIFSRVVHRRIDASLRHLHGAIDRCRAGKLQQPASHHDLDEFEALGRALNDMAASLDRQLLALGSETRQWHALFTSMREGLVAVDCEMKIMTINRAATELLRIAYTDQLTGRSLYEVVRLSELQTFVVEMLNPDSAYGEKEIQVSGQGDPRILAVTGVHLPGEPDDAKGALIVMRDITRLRQLENMRKEFVANVSHELKTPITSIKGYVETLQDCIGTDPDNAARFVGIIQRQADHLNAIIEDLLYLSRLEQGDPSVYSDFSPGNLRSTITNAASLCAGAAEAKRIHIAVSCPNIALRANHRLLEHAILNLLENAIKYSGEATTITVTGEREADRAVFAVADQGVGISLADQERIFERFYRVDKSRNRKMGGTGLGLAIVKHIVRVHRGEIRLQSEPGMGSTFTVSLPLMLTAAEPVETVDAP